MEAEGLGEDKISEMLRDLPSWSGDGRKLCAHFEFDDFRGAMQFMQACVDGIEQHNHHPVWTNKFNAVDIELCSFDVGNFVTLKDFEVAHFLESVLREYGAQFGYVRS